MNNVAPSSPGSDHVNSIYIRYDMLNKVELGWDWQGNTYSYPAWLVRTMDNGTAHEYMSYYGNIQGIPTKGTSYGFKIENGGVNSKLWYARVNGYDKLFGNNATNSGGVGRNFINMAYGRSYFGSERQGESDSNDAHFWSCQKIVNLSGQPWVYWQGTTLLRDTDNVTGSNYYWHKISETDHYVKK